MVVLLLLSLTSPARAAEPLTCDQIARLADSGIAVEQLRPIIYEHGVQPGTAQCLGERDHDAALVRVAAVVEKRTAPPLAGPRKPAHRASTALAVGGLGGFGVGAALTWAGSQSDNFDLINGGIIVGGLGVITVATSAIAYLVEFAIL